MSEIEKKRQELREQSIVIEKQDQEFRERSVADWKAMVQGLFVGPVPEKERWTNLPDIVRVLNVVGAKPDGNHMFLPKGGGLDLMKAIPSPSQIGCIELITDNVLYLVKPTELTLNWFGDEAAEWAYFRLEFGGLLSCGFDESTAEDLRDDVIELTPGNYVDQSVREEGHLGHDENGHEIPLPETARDISRLLSGSIVIFAKGSTYNRTSVTYDGRHNKMTPVQFREYIQKAIYKT